MPINIVRLVTVLSLMLLGLTACGGDGGGGGILSGGGNNITVSIVYGSEKEDWLEPLVAQYNATNPTVEDGTSVVIEATPMGSIEAADGIIDETIQPTVWSPASSLYVPVANQRWRDKTGSDLYEGTPNDLVLSPVVIAMWKPMAEALGWPDTPIGWEDIGQLSISDQGWSQYGFPEWGQFKFGHTHPDFSNSGLTSVIAMAYAGADKQRDLTLSDLNELDLQRFMTDVESSIIHYGSSTGFFGRRMFERGPSYLSAAILYENLIVAQEARRIAGEVAQVDVVAIYPKEGTFWSNHPYIILNTAWVSDAQREAAADFEAFLLSPEQQRQTMQFGFRPADPSIALDDPLNAEHGIDPNQPQTILEVPEAEIVSEIQLLWREVKRPVDLVLVVDTSGSMEGAKIAAVRNSLAQFINLLSNRDRLKVVTFSSNYSVLEELTPLGQIRDSMTQRVQGLIEGGGTLLYDSVVQAYTELETDGNPDHIRAIVVLTDGQDTDSQRTVEQVVQEIGDPGEAGGDAIKVFTIAYGGDADTSVLERIADVTGGRLYSGDPDTIDAVYREISLFF